MLPIQDQLRRLQPGMVAMLGLPYDANSSFMRGAALGPARLRETLHSGSGNWSTELGVDLSASTSWFDLGDLSLPTDQQPFERIKQAAGQVLERKARLLAIGGDHSITYPLMRTYARYHAPITILHLDAHPDLYDILDGNLLSHASPFARIMEEGLARRLIQVGIRTQTPHLRQQAQRFGVEVIEMRQWRPDYPLDLPGPFYLSLDLDVLDPAFAPGVAHHEPGGMTTRDLLDLLQRLPGPIIGADLVEFNPLRDPSGITASLAAKLCKEILGRMLETAPATVPAPKVAAPE